MATQFQQLTLADLPQLTEHAAAWQRGEHDVAPRPVAERLARRILGLGGSGLAWLIRIGGRPAGYLVVSIRNGEEDLSSRGEVMGFFLERSARHAGVEREVREFLASVGRWLGIVLTATPLAHDSLALPSFRSGRRAVQLPPAGLHRATA